MEEENITFPNDDVRDIYYELKSNFEFSTSDLNELGSIKEYIEQYDNIMEKISDSGIEENILMRME